MNKQNQKGAAITDVIVGAVLCVLVVFIAIIYSVHRSGAASTPKCLNSLKQIGTGIAIYSSENSFGVFPNRGPQKALHESGIISDVKVFWCPLREEWDKEYGDYLRSGTAKTWAHNYRPDVIIAGDQKSNHNYYSVITLFKDGHGYIHRLDDTAPDTPAIGLKGLYSQEDEIYSRSSGQKPEEDTWLNWKE